MKERKVTNSLTVILCSLKAKKETNVPLSVIVNNPKDYAKYPLIASTISTRSHVKSSSLRPK